MNELLSRWPLLLRLLMIVGLALTLLLSQDNAGGTTSAYLVKDIFPGESSSLYVSNSWFTNVNGTLFFTPVDDDFDQELWKSDGTEAGTVLVKDIRPGTDSSSPSNLTEMNNTLYFRAYDDNYGTELWKSDGTDAGTVRVKDICPGLCSGVSDPLINVGNTLFLSATDGDDDHGLELWKSDGSEAGTVLVKDISPGYLSSLPGNFTDMNGILIFTARDGYQLGLWKSNGTGAGTTMVTDFSALGVSNPYNFTNVNGAVFFSANDVTHGQELWTSDGIPGNTILVKDIKPGANGSSPNWLTNVNGTLFFTAYDNIHGEELWKSDGTSAGTVLVKDICPGTCYSNPEWLTNINGTLFFSANDGSEITLWKSDGTETGTVMVRDYSPKPGGPAYLTKINDLLLFSAGDYHGGEPWQSDGTAEGTVMIQDINPSSRHSVPSSFTLVDSTVFFIATHYTTGAELWALPLFGYPTYQLSVTVTGSGTISLDPPGSAFDEGTEVQLAATANPGWVFSGWSGHLVGSNNPVTITMDSNKSVTATFIQDSDNDGISNVEENAGPNNGDGNNDDMLDSQQSNVASLLSYDQQNYVTLSSPDETALSSVQVADNPSLEDAPEDIDFPYGFFKFTISGVESGCAITVTLYLPADVITPTTYYKYGPTPDTLTAHWYEFLDDGQTGAVITENVITLRFVDGQRGDDDLTANGIIVEPGGPASAAQPPETQIFLPVILQKNN